MTHVSRWCMHFYKKKLWKKSGYLLVMHREWLYKVRMCDCIHTGTDNLNLRKCNHILLVLKKNEQNGTAKWNWSRVSEHCHGLDKGIMCDEEFMCRGSK